MEKKIEKKNNYTNTNPNNLAIPKLIKNNKFELLQEEYDSDEEAYNFKKSRSKSNVNTKAKAKEEFPALSSSKKTLNVAETKFQVSYKEAANKGHQEAVKEEILTEIYVAKKKEEEIKKPIILVEKKRKPKPINWADYSSSDDEEDDYDNDYHPDYELYELKKPSDTTKESFDYYEY